MAAADQEARNVAILVVQPARRPGSSTRSWPTSTAASSRSVAVLTRGRHAVSGTGRRPGQDPDVRRALAGEAFARRRRAAAAGCCSRSSVAGRHAVVRATVTAADLQPRRGAGPGPASSRLGAGAARARLADRRAGSGGGSASRCSEVAQTAHRLREGDLTARAEVRGTAGDRGAGAGAERPGRAHRRAARRRAGRRRRPVPPAAHAGDRAAPRRRGGDGPRAGRPAAGRTSPRCSATIDAIVKEARRPVQDTTSRAPLRRRRGGRATGSPSGAPLAEDQGRALRVDARPGPLLGPAWRRADLADLLDVLIDNVFAHTPDGTGFAGPARLDHGAGTRGVVLLVADDGPGWRRREPPAPGPGQHRARARHRAAYALRAAAAGWSPAPPRTGGARVEVALPLVVRLTARAGAPQPSSARPPRRRRRPLVVVTAPSSAGRPARRRRRRASAAAVRQRRRLRATAAGVRRGGGPARRRGPARAPRRCGRRGSRSALPTGGPGHAGRPRHDGARPHRAAAGRVVVGGDRRAGRRAALRGRGVGTAAAGEAGEEGERAQDDGEESSWAQRRCVAALCAPRDSLKSLVKAPLTSMTWT